MTGEAAGGESEDVTGEQSLRRSVTGEAASGEPEDMTGEQSLRRSVTGKPRSGESEDVTGEQSLRRSVTGEAASGEPEDMSMSSLLQDHPRTAFPLAPGTPGERAGVRGCNILVVKHKEPLTLPLSPLRGAREPMGLGSLD
jgi:hypothetical protein